MRHTKPILAWLVFWAVLVGWAVAENEAPVPPPDLAVPEECWPPPCRALSCDPCDPLRSMCPRCDELFLVPPRPRLYGIVDGGGLRRNPGHTVNFASMDDPGNIVLATNNFNYDFRATGQVLVGCTINECLQIEGAYMAVSEAEDTAAVRGQANLFSPFGGFGANPIDGVDFNDFAQIHYTSSLQGGELNIRRHMPVPPSRLTMSILFGVRYIGLPEDLDYHTESVAASNSIHVSANNQMVGPQLGARCEFYVDNRWWTCFEAKGALLNNRASQTTSGNVNFLGAAVPFSNSVREDHTSFAGELALTANYRWSPHFATRLGYRALWLTGVALAADNLNADLNLVVEGPAQLNHRSQTVYHGPFAGFEVGW